MASLLHSYMLVGDLLTNDLLAGFWNFISRVMGKSINAASFKLVLENDHSRRE